MSTMIINHYGIWSNNYLTLDNDIIIFAPQFNKFLFKYNKVIK